MIIPVQRVGDNIKNLERRHAMDARLIGTTLTEHDDSSDRHVCASATMKFAEIVSLMENDVERRVKDFVWWRNNLGLRSAADQVI